ncbi:MAG TPA: hypothetical protein VGJ81_06405 [Thermoanaerobaculia bacterium]|jgi:hypothetical protein
MAERSNTAGLIEFAINLKRSSHQLLSCLDVVYGAFLSYFLWVVGQTITSYFERPTAPAGFKLVCMSLMFLFIIEDFRDVKLITSICGYHLSSFRFFLDIAIVLILFTTTLFLFGKNPNAQPNRNFLFSFAIVFFLCTAWALLLTKDKRDVPPNYSVAVAASHFVVGCTWLVLWAFVSQAGVLWRLPLVSPAVRLIMIAVFSIYYIMASWLFGSLRRRGIPVDDYGEMIVPKVARNVVALFRSAAGVFRSGLSRGEPRWRWFRGQPRSTSNHYVVVAQFADGTSTPMQLTDYVNLQVRRGHHCVYVTEDGAAHEGDGATIRLTATPEQDQKAQFLVQEKNPPSERHRT